MGASGNSGCGSLVEPGPRWLFSETLCGSRPQRHMRPRLNAASPGSPGGRTSGARGGSGRSGTITTKASIWVESQLHRAHCALHEVAATSARRGSPPRSLRGRPRRDANGSASPPRGGGDRKPADEPRHGRSGSARHGDGSLSWPATSIATRRPGGRRVGEPRPLASCAPRRLEGSPRPPRRGRAQAKARIRSEVSSGSRDRAAHVVRIGAAPGRGKGAIVRAGAWTTCVPRVAWRSTSAPACVPASVGLTSSVRVACWPGHARPRQSASSHRDRLAEVLAFATSSLRSALFGPRSGAEADWPGVGRCPGDAETSAPC